MTQIDLGPIEAIPCPGARKVKTPEGCIAVFRTAPDQVHATGGTCPHKDGPLVEGIVHAHKVTCPLHNMVFDLTTGLAVGEDHSIPVYPVEIRDGRVMLDLAARPLAAAE